MTRTDKSAKFTTMHSPDWTNRNRWICHDKDEMAAGEYFSEAEARAAVKRWNENECDIVTVEWKDIPEFESMRGIYSVRIIGTRVCSQHSGTFGMEESVRTVVKWRDLMCELGKEQFIKVANTFKS